MALIACPECGREISDMAETCINCGYPIGTAANKVEPDVELESDGEYIYSGAGVKLDMGAVAAYYGYGANGEGHGDAVGFIKLHVAGESNVDAATKVLNTAYAKALENAAPVSLNDGSGGSGQTLDIAGFVKQHGFSIILITDWVQEQLGLSHEESRGKTHELIDHAMDLKRSEEVPVVRHTNSNDAPYRCPHCGSTSVTVLAQGFNGWTALCVGLLISFWGSWAYMPYSIVLGFAAGSIGAKNLTGYCLACKYDFDYD